jgi:hypothetical protein
MGLMDKLKSTAQEVAVEAKKATAQAQGKLEETQLKRKKDDSARELGYLVFAEKTQGNADPARIEELVVRISSLESEMRERAADTHARQEAAAGAPLPGRAGPGVVAAPDSEPVAPEMGPTPGDHQP